MVPALSPAPHASAGPQPDFLSPGGERRVLTGDFSGSGRV